MNVKEAEKEGCPLYILNKIKRVGLDSFSRPHRNKSDLDWKALGKHADFLYYRDHPEKMFFGKKLRELRLRHAEMGLHKFHEAMGTTLKVSELFDIEHGYASPPDCGRFMAQILKVLDVPDDHQDWLELRDLRYDKPFVMQEKDENVVVSPLVHKTDGTRLSEEEYRGLNTHINNVAKEHNKKAREFNGTE